MLRSLELGGLRVPNPIVAMPGDGRGFFGASWVDGSLGAPILRRSTLFIDYPHSQLIIEPAADWEEPFAFDVSGLALQAGGAALEQVEIEGVTPGSAASVAGLAAGELVLAVDSHPVSAASMETIAELFKRVGATHTLRVAQGGEVRDVLLRLESNGLG
jgi:S1-C subfamily serine protease